VEVWCLNFIVTDGRGEATLIEIAYSHRGTKRIGQESKDQLSCGTNHYALPTMMPCDTRRMWQSVVRYKTIESRMKSAMPSSSKDTAWNILSEPMPTGVCCHHYSGWLGTLGQ